MNKRGQQRIIEWAMGGIVMLVLIYVFFQIGKSFCQADSSFCGYFGMLIAAIIGGAVWYLKFGNR